MPIIVRSRVTSPDALREMATNTIDTKPDRFPADNHTARSQKVFDFSRAKRQQVIRPYMGKEHRRVRLTLPRERGLLCWMRLLQSFSANLVASISPIERA